METLTDMNWLLSVGTFLPLRRRAGDAVHPARGRGRCIKTVGIVTAGCHARRRHRHARPASTTASPRSCSSSSTHEWIEVIHSNYTIGLDGISLPLYFLSMVITFLVMIYSWDNMPDAGQPEGVLHPDARAADRHGRHVRRPGPHLVLRLLRGRAAADVLHDRRVGRRAAPVRVAEVLPLHDVRLGVDARRVPRPVLPDRRARASRFQYLDRGRRRHRQATCRSGSSPACSSASPSRCRCSRSTRGCPTPTPRRRRRARSSSPRSC